MVPAYGENWLMREKGRLKGNSGASVGRKKTGRWPTSLDSNKQLVTWGGGETLGTCGVGTKVG